MNKLLLLFVFGLPGCVVTTLEGPGEPPRVAPAPNRPTAVVESKPDPNEPESIVARHVLVAYSGAMRASPNSASSHVSDCTANQMRRWAKKSSPSAEPTRGSSRNGGGYSN